MKGLNIKYKNSYLSYLVTFNFFFLAFALLSSLISIYLKNLGFDSQKVSNIVSTAFFMSMVTQPFIGRLNDKYDVKKVTILLLILSALGGSFLIFSHNYWIILVGYAWAMIVINGLNPVMEKIATSSHYSYGNIRIWGTLGYALGTQVSGLLYDYIAPEAMFVAFVLAIVLAIIGVLGIQVINDKQPIISSVELAANSQSIRAVFKDSRLVIYTIVVIVVAGLMNTMHTYIPPALEAKGLAVRTASTVVSLSVLCETPLIFFSYLFMDKYKSKHLFLLSIILFAFQCFAYFAFDHISLVIFATMLTKHISGMIFIMVNNKIVYTLAAPQHLITTLAIVQTGRNLGSILFQNLAGYLLKTQSYEEFFFIIFLLALVIMLVIVFIKLPDGTDIQLFSKK